MSGFEAFGFNTLIDQKLPVQLLTSLLNKGTIPHALLFIGPNGVGKLNAAGIFAMACNCGGKKDPLLPKEEIAAHDSMDLHFAAEPSKEDPCGRCISCRKILSGNHPDIISIKPSNSLINIGQIRTLCHTLSLKPYEAKARVVIIACAHTMNKGAGNALLKMLEEPPGRTVFILTALQKSDLLPTILSRCQQIRFNPLSRKGIESFLEKNYDFNNDERKIYSKMADGSLSRAQQMAGGPGGGRYWLTRRNWLIDEACALSSRPIGSLLVLAEKLAKKKDTITESLDVIVTWLRDLVIHKYYPEKIVNSDLADKIKKISLQESVESLVSKIEAVRTAQRKIDANANLRLTLEIMLMSLSQR
jgi:DNA polymerase-3 subunit delta'